MLDGNDVMVIVGLAEEKEVENVPDVRDPSDEINGVPMSPSTAVGEMEKKSPELVSCPETITNKSHG